MKIEDFKKELLKNPRIRHEFETFDLAFEISQMLIEARIINSITQDKLAKLIGTKQTSIARAESGKHLPSLSFLDKIAKAFGTFLVPPRFGFMEDYTLDFDTRSKKAGVKNVHEVHGSYKKNYLPNNTGGSDNKIFALRYSSQ